MKNLAVALVFVLSLLGFVATLTAEAHSEIRVEPAALDEPVALTADDDADRGDELAQKDKKKKKKGDKKDDDDEEDEEEYRSDSARALELVDPGAADFVIGMNGATGQR